MECKDLFRCLFNVGENEISIYKILLKREMRVNKIEKLAGKERSTVHRRLQRLVSCGIVKREKKIIEKGGGYYHVYKAIPPQELKRWLVKCINKWQNEMKEAIEKVDEEITI